MADVGNTKSSVAIEIPADLARHLAEGGRPWDGDLEVLQRAAAAVVPPRRRRAPEEDFDRAFWQLARKGQMSFGHHLVLCAALHGQLDESEDLADELASDMTLAIVHGSPSVKTVNSWIRTLQDRGLLERQDETWTVTPAGLERLQEEARVLRFDDEDLPDPDPYDPGPGSPSIPPQGPPREPTVGPDDDGAGGAAGAVAHLRAGSSS